MTENIPSCFSLCWQCLSSNGLRNDQPVHDEPGPRIPWQLELKSDVFWISLGVFNHLLLCVYTITCWLTVIIKIIMTAIIGYELGRTCILSFFFLTLI